MCAHRRGPARRHFWSAGGDPAAPSLAAGARARPLAPFPWRRAIGFGLGSLRLSPESFWRMTPRELAFAYEALAPAASASLGRGEFAALAARFPDDLSEGTDVRHL
ncbi:MAG: phage tail assembly chaperone [Rhizobiales bacterium]|nr:phage tail assembly chaperone [Hyphomicrobiales bacterium]